MTVEIQYQCKMAFYEAVTNAVKHGHKGLPPETLVEIEVTLTANSITIQVWDRGEGFDLQEMYYNELREWPERGRGVYIIKQIADFMSYALGYYHNGDRRNCLTIVKSY